MNIKEQVQRAIIPRMHQFSGIVPHSGNKNICLIDSGWFLKFQLWATSGGSHPGTITNESLKEKIDSGQFVKEGSDYEYCDTNVFDALVNVFTGGPKIQRPYMVSPITGKGRVVISPIKFDVNIDGAVTKRTADPDWNLLEFISNVMKKEKYDVSQVGIRVGENKLSNDSTMKEIKETFGVELIVDLPLQTQIGKKITSSPTSLKAASRSFNRANNFSMGSAASLPPRDFQSSITSMFNSFMYAFATTPKISQIVQGIQRENLGDDSLMAAFFDYIQEVNKFPNNLIQPQEFHSIFTRLRPELGSIRNFDSAATISAIVTNLAQQAPDQDEFSQIMCSKVTIEQKCTKCGYTEKNDIYLPCFKLEVQSKLFKKPTLQDCISAFLQLRKIGHGKKDTCKKCKKKINLREQIKVQQLPDVLILTIARFVREGESMRKKSNEINYSHEISLEEITGLKKDKYELRAVVSHAGNSINQKSKVIIRDKQDKNKWLLFGELSAKIINSNSAILPGSAVFLIYQRCP